MPWNMGGNNLDIQVIGTEADFSVKDSFLEREKESIRLAVFGQIDFEANYTRHRESICHCILRFITENRKGCGLPFLQGSYCPNDFVFVTFTKNVADMSGPLDGYWNLFIHLLKIKQATNKWYQLIPLGQLVFAKIFAKDYIYSVKKA
jgi:hypothetical protein